MIINLGFMAIYLGRDNRQTRASLGQLVDARGGGNAWGTGQEWAPQSYGHYYAQSVPAYRAVKLRADAVASAPLKLYRRRPDGTDPMPDNHPIQQLLDKVNSWWTASDLWRATETYLSLWGSAYWFLERKGSQVVGIWPLRPDRMRIIAGGGSQPEQYITGFLYQADRTLRLGREDVVWFRYFNPMDEYAGLAPVAPARLTLDMGRDALRFNRNFFRNGAVPQDLVFTVNGPVTEEQVNDFYMRLEKRHSGASNAHRPMVWDLTQGGEPKRLGLSQRDMEFMAALSFTVEDAARIWGVPPPKLYSQTQSIYNNVKQADIEFYTDTVSTEWAFLATEVNEMLLPLLAPNEPDLFVVFDTAGVLPLQEALQEQKTADLEEVKNGTMTINEYRAKYNREQVAWGDAWWRPFTMVPTEDATVEAPALPTRGVMEKSLVSFERRLRQGDSEFTVFQRRLFREQEQDVLARLRQHKGIRQVDDSIFEQERWTLAFADRGRPIITTILTRSALAQAAEFGLGAFDAERMVVRDWVAQRTIFWAQRVNLETAQLLMEELAEARALGEGIPQMQQRIEKVFRFNDQVRSERIARTETLSASNRGHLEIYRQSGVVEEKQWLATLDERTRAAHAQAHRQVVALEAQFFVGGEMMDAPGDGSPGNVINCRCVVQPVIRRKQLLLPSTNGHIAMAQGQ